MKLPRNKKIIFFCAHPDDDTFSSGAIIHKLVKNKNKVLCIYLTSSPRAVLGKKTRVEKRIIRMKEGENACKVLGAEPVFLNLDDPVLKATKQNIKLISGIIKKEKPQIIFLPTEYDAHPTHRKVNKIVEKAGKKVKQKWYYETWTPILSPNYIYFFDEKEMKIKKTAMKKHKSQLERADFSEATVALNKFRGIMGPELLGEFSKKYKKQKYGEAFLIKKN